MVDFRMCGSLGHDSGNTIRRNKTKQEKDEPSTPQPWAKERHAEDLDQGRGEVGAGGEVDRRFWRFNVWVRSG